MLEERAMLVRVTVRCWSATVTDSRASEEIASSKRASAEFVRLKKTLIGQRIRELSSLAADIRRTVRKQTLPWYDEGWRILPAERWLDFTQEMAKLKQSFEKRVQEFVREYPSLVTEAKTALGDLYDPAEYPDPSAVAELFRIEVDYMPIPRARDFRLDALREAMMEVEEKVERRYREAFGRIKEHLAGRITELCERIIRCLTGDRIVVTKALIRDIGETARLLPDLNIIDDPTIAIAASELEKMASYDAEFVRRSSIVQSFLLSRAQALLRIVNDRDEERDLPEQPSDEGPPTGAQPSTQVSELRA